MSVDPISALPSRPSPGVAGARLGALYADHARMVYGICRMILRDAEDAEDATQQVFLSAYRSLLTGTEVRDPAAWLGTIARNACRRRATSRLREPVAFADQPTLLSPGVEEQASRREDAAELYAELAALPEKQREAVVLRDMYGLRYDEVAAALGTSRPAVEALLFRARRRLQRRLRPGVAAGVLVVPLAVHESIAYAVPGFTAPAGAAVTAAGIPILAKLAATGAAVGLAGSAGVVVQQRLHDPPTRPVQATRSTEASVAAVAPLRPAALLPALPATTRGVVRDSGSGHGGDDEAARAVADTGDRDRDDGTETRDDRSDEQAAEEAEDDPKEDERARELDREDWHEEPEPANEVESGGVSGGHGVTDEFEADESHDEISSGGHGWDGDDGEELAADDDH